MKRREPVLYYLMSTPAGEGPRRMFAREELLLVPVGKTDTKTLYLPSFQPLAYPRLIMTLNNGRKLWASLSSNKKVMEPALEATDQLQYSPVSQR